MADRPILFSAPMVRALLNGTKTQTRRALNPQPPSWVYPNDKPGYSCLTPKGCIEFRGRYVDEAGEDHGPASKFVKLPYLKGDHLWVRESYYQRGHWEPVEGTRTKGGRQKWAFMPIGPISFDAPAEFRKGRHSADPETVAWHKRLGRFMPRAASRLTLTVTDVRVERLQDISEADAIAEGIYRLGGLYCHSRPGDHFGNESAIAVPAGWDQATYAYQALWDRINGPGAWEANPWVVAVSFDVERRNIDAGGAA